MIFGQGCDNPIPVLIPEVFPVVNGCCQLESLRSLLPTQRAIVL